MLLARAGVDVLVVDRAGYGSETLSSHALMRNAVDQLARWGLLDKVAATTPPINRTVFDFAGERVVVPSAKTGDSPLYAPRRTVLDPILVDAARDAGAEFRFHTRVTELIRDTTGRVRGVVTEDEVGRRNPVGATLVVGADGLRSFVARNVDAPTTRSGHHALASLYAYVRQAELPIDDYWFAYGDRLVGGSIPTNDDQHVIFASMSLADFQLVRLDPQMALIRSLGRVSRSLGDGARAGTIVGAFRSFPGCRGRFLKPHGRGWALVGDAGFFKDPAAAHGLSDALRDAELLSAAILTSNLDDYERVRDTLSMPLFEHIDRLASLDWQPHESAKLLAEMGRAMAAETDALRLHRASSAVFG